jgi:hypothetical protein
VGIFGVTIFVLGAIALATVILRRGNGRRAGGLDHFMLFLGIAGIITGLAVVFMRFN